jgi:signal transduction histidine kinase
MLGGMTDITERKRTEQRSHLQYLITRILVESADLDEASVEILEWVCRQLNWDRGELWMVEGEPPGLKCAACWGGSTADRKGLTPTGGGAARGLQKGEGLAGLVWEEGRPVWKSDLRENPLLQSHGQLDAGEWLGAFAVPVRKRGTVTGVLAFFSRDLQREDKELMESLVSIGHQIGLFIQRKEADEALRRLPQRILEAQESERRRVSRELHDSVNQLLASVRFRLQSIEDRIPRGAEALQLQQETGKTKRLLEYALSEVRRISHNLRPSELDDLGLVPAIRAAGEEFSVRSGIKWELETGAALPDRLPAATELSVYRIFQESLNNVERHARAGRVQVQLTLEAGHMKLRIRDDGIGFDPDQKLRGRRGRPGIGLENIRERAAFIQGELSIGSAPGQGTEITLRIPLEFDETDTGNSTDHPLIVG